MGLCRELENGFSVFCFEYNLHRKISYLGNMGTNVITTQVKKWAIVSTEVEKIALWSLLSLLAKTKCRKQHCEPLIFLLISIFAYIAFIIQKTPLLKHTICTEKHKCHTCVT